jgi:hypothetical protein
MLPALTLGWNGVCAAAGAGPDNPATISVNTVSSRLSFTLVSPLP